jgi:hypothetical protein
VHRRSGAVRGGEPGGRKRHYSTPERGVRHCCGQPAGSQP